jgi:hypothetical protein
VYKILSDKFDKDKDDSKLRELYNSLLEIKLTYNINPNLFRRLDNMNSLTLRSEYSMDKSDLMERRLLSPQNEHIAKNNHELFSDIENGKVVNTDAGNQKGPKKPLKKAKPDDKVEKPTSSKLNVNVLKQNPNRTLNSKDTKYSFEKSKAKIILNKKLDRLSPRPINKDSLTSPTAPLITNIIAKPIRTNKSTYIKTKTESLPLNKNKSLCQRESTETLMKTSLTQFTKTEKTELFIQEGIEYDKVSEGWMISPMNKIPVRASKIIPEKNVVRNGYRSLPKYMNLK